MFFPSKKDVHVNFSGDIDEYKKISFFSLRPEKMYIFLQSR